MHATPQTPKLASRGRASIFRGLDDERMKRSGSRGELVSYHRTRGSLCAGVSRDGLGLHVRHASESSALSGACAIPLSPAAVPRSPDTRISRSVTPHSFLHQREPKAELDSVVVASSGTILSSKHLPVTEHLDIACANVSHTILQEPNPLAGASPTKECTGLAVDAITSAEHQLDSKSRTLRVFCGTWNMHAKVPCAIFSSRTGALPRDTSSRVSQMPPSDLTPFIPLGAHDLYVIGTEECQNTIQVSFIFSSKDKWTTMLQEHFGNDGRGAGTW